MWGEAGTQPGSPGWVLKQQQQQQQGSSISSSGGEEERWAGNIGVIVRMGGP